MTFGLLETKNHLRSGRGFKVTGWANYSPQANKPTTWFCTWAKNIVYIFKWLNKIKRKITLHEMQDIYKIKLLVCVRQVPWTQPCSVLYMLSTCTCWLCSLMCTLPMPVSCTAAELNRCSSDLAASEAKDTYPLVLHQKSLRLGLLPGTCPRMPRSTQPMDHWAVISHDRHTSKFWNITCLSYRSNNFSSPCTIDGDFSCLFYVVSLWPTTFFSKKIRKTMKVPLSMESKLTIGNLYAEILTDTYFALHTY